MAKHLPLITRLTRQLAADSVPDARAEALAILRDRGHVYKNSERLTVEGKKREALGPAGRAIDRASKLSGHPASAYRYDPRTGRAVLK
jgi:hypothetical protein